MPIRASSRRNRSLLWATAMVAVVVSALHPAAPVASAAAAAVPNPPAAADEPLNLPRLLPGEAPILVRIDGRLLAPTVPPLVRQGQVLVRNFMYTSPNWLRWLAAGQPYESLSPISERSWPQSASIYGAPDSLMALDDAAAQLGWRVQRVDTPPYSYFGQAYQGEVRIFTPWYDAGLDLPPLPLPPPPAAVSAELAGSIAADPDVPTRLETHEWASADAGRTWERTRWETDDGQLLQPSDGPGFWRVDGSFAGAIRVNPDLWYYLEDRLRHVRRLWRSTDRGRTWADTGRQWWTPIGGMMFSPDGSWELTSSYSGLVIRKDGALIRVLNPIPGLPGYVFPLLYLPTDPPRIFVRIQGNNNTYLAWSDDEGETWQGLPFDLAPLTAQRDTAGSYRLFHVASKERTLFRSDDLGDSWHPIRSDAVGLYGDPYGAGLLLVLTDSGLFRSVDAGDTWQGPLNLPMPTSLTPIGVGRDLYLTNRPPGEGGSGLTALTLRMDADGKWQSVDALPLAAPASQFTFTHADGAPSMRVSDANGSSRDYPWSWLFPCCPRNLTVDPTDPETVYVGYPGGVAISRTGGGSYGQFTPLVPWLTGGSPRPNGNAPSVLLSPERPGLVVALQHTIGVWVSWDYGASWRFVRGSATAASASLQVLPEGTALWLRTADGPTGFLIPLVAPQPAHRAAKESVVLQGECCRDS